jgi:hypothetical protein
MTTRISKSVTLFDRDEKGELLPKEVELVVLDDEMKEYEGQSISITPMTRGEIKSIFTKIDGEGKDKDLDGELILKHCIEPKYDEEEVKHLKPGFATMLVNTIMKHSGLKVDTPKKQAIAAKEDDFAKN